MYLIFIMHQVDKCYTCIQNSEPETFNVAKSLFYLYSHVLVDIKLPSKWFCAFAYHSEALI